MSNVCYVLDTSVLVHDPESPRAFVGNTVAIPIFVVMELDDLKNSRRWEVASSARRASRFIASLREFGALGETEGIHHPELDIRYQIVSNNSNGLEELTRSTNQRSMDMLILESALHLKRSGNHDRVVLVSKDVNLRILADFEGLEAQDYERDRVELTDLYPGYRFVNDFPSQLLQQAYLPDGRLTPADLDLTSLCSNEFVISRGDREHVLRYDAETDSLRPVPKEFGRSVGVQPRNVEQRMALSLLLNPDIRLVSLIGKAGTGKTFLALAAALAQLHRERRGESYDRILLSKPVVSMGKDVGYLPGDFETKMQPWMTSFFDNLDQLIPTDEEATNKGATQAEKSWEHLFESRQLEVQAIHTIRGRSIPKAFMVIDEAQNLTPHEVKTIITRAAEGTKVVLAGDPYQVDNHFLDQHSNGLVYVTERLKNSPICGTVFFTKGERSVLAELAATML